MANPLHAAWEWLVAGLRTPVQTVEATLLDANTATDADLLFRQNEWQDLLAACGRATAAEWQAEIIETTLRQRADIQQRLTDWRTRALSQYPSGKRNRLLDTYLDALDRLPATLRERELRQMRRSIKLLGRDQQAEIEARLASAD